MVFDPLLPARLAGLRVEPVDAAVLVAEDERCSGWIIDRERRRTDGTGRLERPMQASTFRIDRAHRAAGAPHEHRSVEHGGCPECGHVAGKAEGPFQLERAELLGLETRLLCA